MNDNPKMQVARLDDIERRVALIATLAFAAVAAGGLVLAATSLRIGSGVALDLLGVAAAVGALAVVAALARPQAADSNGDQT